MEENNYKLMVSMLGTMKSSLETLKDTISNQLRTDFKLNDEIIDASLPYMIEDIPNMGETELRNIFTKYSLTTEPNTDSLEDLRKNFKTIKNIYNVIFVFYAISIICIFNFTKIFKLRFII